VVLFDGVCNFCNASVNFLLDHDPQHRLRFAALQSQAGQALLHRFKLPTSHFDTLVLVDGPRCYTRSDAALRIAGRLGGWWPLLSAFLLVPPFLRDGAYDLLARNRYRWFGKREACRMPTPDLRARFLE
jgi:predicted DCC family thiol-disulfide oxidoreductase YuxK